MRVMHRFMALVGVGLLLFGGPYAFTQGPPGAPPSGPVSPFVAPSANPYAVAPGQMSPSVAPNSPANYSTSLSDPEYGGYPAVIPPSPPPMGDPTAYGSTINPYPTISPYSFS